MEICENIFNNIERIKSNNCYISETKREIDLKTIKYINKIVVRKYKNTSFVLSSMSSLSQIFEFTDYFLSHDFSDMSQLIIYFKDYLKNLWIKTNDKNQQFKPEKFIKYLKDKKFFEFEKEIEPINFIKKIIESLHKELNNKDKKISTDIIKIKKEFNDYPNFVKYLDDTYFKENNSIISKIFYGIMTCKLSGPINEQKEFKYFYYIELEINKYLNYKKDSDDSLIDYYLDELIDYYFGENKKIILWPNVLIVWINWEKFSYEKGFDLEDNNLIFEELIDLSKYSFIRNKKIKYKLRSVINYPIINESNEKNKSYHQFLTFSRHLVDSNCYSYTPNGEVKQIHYLNRRFYVPSLLFYEIQN